MGHDAVQREWQECSSGVAVRGLRGKRVEGPGTLCQLWSIPQLLTTEDSHGIEHYRIFETVT